jgi:hypothetical protein
MNFTYLIAHAGSEELFDACKGAINKYTTGNIITSDKTMFKHWGEAFRWLFNNCPTDVGIFIDDDALILRDITSLIKLVESGECGIVGFTNRGVGKHTEYQYFQPNFMIINIKRFKEEFGAHSIDVDIELAKNELGVNPEFMYGISQKLRGRNNKDLSSKLIDKYWPANVLSDGDTDYVLHLWYGAWKHRKSPVGDMNERDMMVIKDFWDNKLKIPHD